MRRTEHTLTPDLTYRGTLLTQSAYRAHLDILQAYVDGKTPENTHHDDLAFHQASIAVGSLLEYPQCENQRGHITSATPFHWCRKVLTLYGKLYAAQRGIG